MAKIYVSTNPSMVVNNVEDVPGTDLTEVDKPVGFAAMGSTLSGGVLVAPTSRTTEQELLARIGRAYRNMNTVIHDWWQYEMQGSTAVAESVAAITATHKWNIHLAAVAVNFVKGTTGSLDAAGKESLVARYELFCTGQHRINRQDWAEVWYRVMLDNDTLRGLWATVSVAVGAPLYADIWETDGSARTVDGSYNLVGGNMPDFNPAHPE